MTVAATLARIRCIAAVPLQRRRAQGSLRSLWFTIAFAMFLPALSVFAAIFMGGTEAWLIAGVITLILTTLLGLGAWAVFLSGLHLQADFATARLVPAQTRHLHLTMAMGVAVMCAAFGVLGHLFFGHGVLVAVGMLMLLTLVTLLAGRRWLAAIAVAGGLFCTSQPSFGTRFMDSFNGLLAHQAFAIPIVVATCLLLLRLSAPASRGAARSPRSVPHLRAGTEVVGDPAGPEPFRIEQGPQPSQPGRLHARWRSGRIPAVQRDPLRRALAVLPLYEHWGHEWRAWLGWAWVFGQSGLLALGVVQRHADLLFLLLAVQGQVLMLASVLVVRIELAKTRGEQALMSLLPGMPAGAALTRQVALRLCASYLAGLVRGTVMLALIGAMFAWSGAPLSWLESPTALAALPLACVPMATLLWTNWAPASAMRISASLVVVAIASLVAFAMLAPHFDWASLGTVAALYTLPTLAWCAWRWHRMAGEPASLPAGRLDA